MENVDDDYYVISISKVTRNNNKVTSRFRLNNIFDENSWNIMCCCGLCAKRHPGCDCRFPISSEQMYHRLNSRSTTDEMTGGRCVASLLLQLSQSRRHQRANWTQCRRRRHLPSIFHPRLTRDSRPLLSQRRHAAAMFVSTVRRPNHRDATAENRFIKNHRTKCTAVYGLHFTRFARRRH